MDSNLLFLLIAKNRFCIFKSVNDDEFYIIYISNPINGLISYNLIDYKIINKIKNAHDKKIVDIRHFGDKINKNDVILSATIYSNIKLWNFTHWECLLNLETIYSKGYMYSTCFLTENNLNYIITCHCTSHCEPIKVYDFYGNNIKEIFESNEEAFYVDSYYDIELSKTFLITCNKGFIKSYDFKNNILFQKYFDEEQTKVDFYRDIIIYSDEKLIKLIKLISPKNYFYIRIWDFHKGNILDKIELKNNRILSIFYVIMMRMF